jgi:glycosyltransferase involved in cell wall biosynthesis
MKDSFMHNEEKQNIIEKSNNPKVSIIVPVYNIPKKYLRECLKSIVEQTLKDIEVIVVNDGSTNNSLEILKEYVEEDSRIILLDKENGGVSSARNAGLNIAKGEYVSFIDADDWVENNFYEVLYKTAKRENADICTTYLERFYISRQADFINGGVAISSWNKIYKMDLLKKNNIVFFPIMGEDLLFDRIARYFANKRSLANYESGEGVSVYYYRLQRENSFTDTVWKQTQRYDCSIEVKYFLDFLDSSRPSKKKYIEQFEMIFIDISFILTHAVVIKDQEIVFYKIAQQFQRCKYIDFFKTEKPSALFIALLNSNFNDYIKAINSNDFQLLLNKCFVFPKDVAYDYTFLTAYKVFEILKKYFIDFKSVLNINCKSLAWFDAFEEAKLNGWEQIELCTLVANLAQKENIKICKVDDLSNKHFDLVIRLPEHFELEETEIKKHIHLLCEVSDIIIFGSDAPLYTEQAEQREPSYYNYLFRQEGFVCFDIFRESLWNAPYVSWPIKQNLVLYVKENKAQELIKQGLKDIEYLPAKYCLDYVNLLKEKSFENAQGLDSKLKKYRRRYQVLAIGFFVMIIAIVWTIILF